MAQNRNRNSESIAGERPKTLILAFACAPDIGSEPEIGWRWAWEMARYADVSVLTDEGHRDAIAAKLAETPGSNATPRFHFFGLGPHNSRLYAWLGYRGYYPWWMRKARRRISALHQMHQFNLMHHVTYSACRSPTAVWNHGPPVIWGPVGGVESMPLDAIPWNQPKAAVFEIARNIGNRIARHNLKVGGGKSSLILASTPETAQAFARVGVHADVMACNGIERSALAGELPVRQAGPLRLVFAGRLLAWKGLHLAIHAVASVPRVIFTIIGDGPYREPCRALAEDLGIGSRVEFRGLMPRPALIRDYASHHALLFPSFHDSGGFAVLEAMANGLPVICLDTGGPALAVRDRCGVRVPVTSREGIIASLVAAIRRYDADRALIEKEGQNARRSVEENYLWERRAERMARYYDAVLTRSARVR